MYKGKNLFTLNGINYEVKKDYMEKLYYDLCDKYKVDPVKLFYDMLSGFSSYYFHAYLHNGYIIITNIPTLRTFRMDNDLRFINVTCSADLEEKDILSFWDWFVDDYRDMKIKEEHPDFVHFCYSIFERD